MGLNSFFCYRSRCPISALIGLAISSIRVRIGNFAFSGSFFLFLNLR